MRSTLIILFLFSLTSVGNSQTVKIDSNSSKNKGKFYISWGWNAGWFSNCDIQFKGADYDFLLEDVVATDRQTPFGLDPYFHPGRITVPQTNFRLGYFFNEKWNISLGFDHMKYVVQQYQTVNITGSINAGNEFDGTYVNEPIELTKSFLEFEHTDGLNYINVELRRFDQLFLKKWFELNLVSGAGVAALIPRTKTVLFDDYNRDAYHISGFGFAPLLGVNLTFFDWFFLQSEFKGGYIHMPNVRISPNAGDKASHSFFFGQLNYVFGFSRKF